MARTKDAGQWSRERRDSVIRQLSIAESAKLQFAGGLILASVLNLARYPFQEAGIGDR